MHVGPTPSSPAGNNQEELVNSNTKPSVMMSPTEFSKCDLFDLGNWIYFLISCLVVLAITNIILVAIILYIW